METSIKNIILDFTGKKRFTKEPFFYLYNLSKIEQQLFQLEQHKLPNVSVFYAMKANSNEKILKILTKKNVLSGVEIASVGELKQALSFFKSSQVLYTGPGKRESELYWSIKKKIKLINVESLTEAHRINQIAERENAGKVDILVRINPDFRIKNPLQEMTGFSSKMGIDEESVFETIPQIKELKCINLKGIHVFAASGILDYLSLLEYVRYIFELVKKLERNHIHIEVIDFGGGFGIDYASAGTHFDVANFFHGLKQLIIEYDFLKKHFILELGRFIVGESGYYVAEIVDIKQSLGKKHIVLAGGLNHLRLIKKHPFFIIPRNKKPIFAKQLRVQNEVVDIDGPLCFSGDKHFENVLVDHAQIGDLFVISLVGAYGYNVASLNFLGHPKPMEIVYKVEEVV